jgi:hypothetical protein
MAIAAGGYIEIPGHILSSVNAREILRVLVDPGLGIEPSHVIEAAVTLGA